MAPMGDRVAPPSAAPPPFGVSLVSCVYNEEGNLPKFLDAVLAASGPRFRVREVIVVASGCTDRSVEILRAYAARDPRVHVIEKPVRDGKAPALRVGLAQATGELVVLENADTVPAPGALAALLAPFERPEVDLVCVRPVPADTPKGFVGRMGETLWLVHDEISRQSPKAGEALAFRRMSPPLDDDVEDDDTFVGLYVGGQGGVSVYVPDAVVFNRVPGTMGELVAQRYRIDRQVVGLRRRTGLLSVAWEPLYLVRAVARFLRARPERIPEVGALAGLELLVRLSAVVTVAVHPRPLRTWAQLRSTKQPIDTAGP